MASNRVISMQVLPGEPLDGSGKVSIHLVVLDPSGPYTEPQAILPMFGEDGVQVKQAGRIGPARARIACNPKLDPAPRTVNGVTHVTMRSGDPRATTCRKCMATEDYRAAMGKLEQPQEQPPEQPAQR